MRVILEGPDGGGKTTLARALLAQFPKVGYHHEGIPRHEITDLRAHYLGLLNRMDNTIFDRLMIGEMVYGPIVRKRDRMGGAIGLEGFLEEAPKNIIIVCLPPYEECRKNWRERIAFEWLKDERVFKQTYDAFVAITEDALPRIGAVFAIYDYTRDRS